MRPLNYICRHWLGKLVLDTTKLKQSMNSLVCISKTPETTAKISFRENNTEFNEDGVQFILNPYDEWYALVRAIELKEAHGGEVTVINVGPSSNDTIIRKAIAIGADKAIRINAVPTSAAFVAEQIAKVAKDGDYDIIFTGKETIDYNSSLVGSMIAAHLDLPFISFANDLKMEGDKAVLSREIEGGNEVSELEVPFVVSAAKGMAEQRIPNMRGIMMAKRKPLDIVEPIAFDEKVSILEYQKPEDNTEVKMVDPENMDELVRLLHEEAKVI